MAQLSLFGNGCRTLVADERGSIAYYPELVDAETAFEWFASLRDSVRWRTERRRMYDRDVDVPRQFASYRLDDPELPPVLAQAARYAHDTVGAPFTAVGMNYYRDGRDSVAPHNDHLNEIATGFPIALISLGASRRMTIRSKKRPRRLLDLDLENGSLLLMSYETQLHYDHGIPKTAEPVGPRISLAFRVRA